MHARARTHTRTHSLNGSEERGAGRERGGLKEKGCREKKECTDRKRWRETWHSKICDTQQSIYCLHDKTKKSEKGATTGNIVFSLQDTLNNKNTTDKVYKGFCILSLILGISGHTFNCSEISYIK